ncbi:hypothetical protein HK097_002043, partial [Rhizophlyctis rosea]
MTDKQPAPPAWMDRSPSGGLGVRPSPPGSAPMSPFAKKVTDSRSPTPSSPFAPKLSQNNNTTDTSSIRESEVNSILSNLRANRSRSSSNAAATTNN